MKHPARHLLPVLIAAAILTPVTGLGQDEEDPIRLMPNPAERSAYGTSPQSQRPIPPGDNLGERGAKIQVLQPFETGTPLADLQRRGIIIIGGQPTDGTTLKAADGTQIKIKGGEVMGIDPQPF